MTHRAALFLAALFLAALFLAALVLIPVARAAPPAGACSTPLPAASDEFTAFDKHRWSTGLWYDVSGVGAFSAANASVANGELRLLATHEASGGKPYTFAAVESSFDIPGAPSYVEVRARVLDSRANVLSAIWLQSSPLTAASNPNPEIDIQETFTYHQLIASLHRWPTPIGEETHVLDWNQRGDVGVADTSRGFHLYGLARGNGMLSFYFDNRLVSQVRPPDPTYLTMPRHLVLSLEGHLGEPVGARLPAVFRIDYVRTYICVSAGRHHPQSRIARSRRRQNS